MPTSATSPLFDMQCRLYYMVELDRYCAHAIPCRSVALRIFSNEYGYSVITKMGLFMKFNWDFLQGYSDNRDYHSNMAFDPFNYSDFYDYFNYSDFYDYNYSDFYDYNYSDFYDYNYNDFFDYFNYSYFFDYYYSDFYGYLNYTDTNDYYYSDILSIIPSFDNLGVTAEAGFIINVVTCIAICIGLPLTLMAIYALYSQVRNDHVAPIYIINLLISDVIQFCCMIVAVAKPEKGVIDIFKNLHRYCVGASVGFMVCVALERYLVIACPLWYRFRRTIEISVLVCVVVWLLPALCFLTVSSCSDDHIRNITFAIFCLLPLPLLIFFLGGTLRALSATNSVPSDEKRRIVGMLVLVLLIYTLLFLPSIIWSLAQKQVNSILYILLHVFRRLSPLADLVLYVFMRKGAVDRLLAAVRCCRMDSNETSSTAVSVVTTHPQSASSRQRQRDTETEIEEGTEDM
ncbi:hypothetical protein ABVT39_007655 [Epinephelus coioides]